MVYATFSLIFRRYYSGDNLIQTRNNMEQQEICVASVLESFKCHPVCVTLVSHAQKHEWVVSSQRAGETVFLAPIFLWKLGGQNIPKSNGFIFMSLVNIVNGRNEGIPHIFRQTHDFENGFNPRCQQLRVTLQWKTWSRPTIRGESLGKPVEVPVHIPLKKRFLDGGETIHGGTPSIQF